MSSSEKSIGSGRGRDDRGPRRSRWNREQSKDEEKEKSDEKIDPTSSSFDPLAALYAKTLAIPEPKAPVYDNLSKFESVMEGKANVSKPKPVETRLTYEDLPPRDLTDTYENLMKWMREIDGPMHLMRDWMENKVKVKIATRNAESVRGYVTGFISAFDKVWNVVVEDATEIWTRKKLTKRKVLPIGEHSAEIPPDTAGRRMQAPVVDVKSISKGWEQCERRIDKLLLKGEHIILVSKLQ